MSWDSENAVTEELSHLDSGADFTDWRPEKRQESPVGLPVIQFPADFEKA